MRVIAKQLFEVLGLYVARQSTFYQAKVDVIGSLKNLLTANHLTPKERNILSKTLSLLIENDGSTHSQLGQDLIALAANSRTRRGFYVEIGGGDPIRSSNTYLLQTKYEWDGILVEPNPDLVASIGNFRSGKNAPIVIQKAIAQKSGKEFLLKAGLLSTLDRFLEGDSHAKQRRVNLHRNGLIEVDAISPEEFVQRYLQVQEVDFLSVDTEGAEMEIMSNWPFDLCKPLVICIEHSSRSWKSELDELITSQGYLKILESISKFDSWFILNKYNVASLFVVYWLTTRMQYN